MSIYPRAKVRLVDRYKPGGTSGGPMPTCGRLILHTAVSSASSLFDFFNTPGNAVAHFYVDGAGNVEQYVDTGREASAVLEGNHNAITVETEDIGSPWWKPWGGSNVPKWTDAQVKALAQIAVWCHRHHDIPIHRLLSSRPGRKGIGWHRQGIDGNFPTTGILRGRVPGGEHWSKSFGKPCPGDNRIRQVVDEVIPLAHALVDKPQAQVDDPTHVELALREVHQSIKGTRKDGPLRRQLRRVARQLRAILNRRPS